MFTRTILAVLASGALLMGSCTRNEYYTVAPDEPATPTYNYIFDDNFNDNINNWAFADPKNSAYVNIDNGQLKYTYLPQGEGSNTVAINTGAKLHQNFLVQTRIKTDYAMGIAFGVSNSDYGYSFFIDDEGYFALYKEGDANNPLQTILDWQYSDAIYKGGWNEIEFEQVGNYWTGYANGVKLFEVQAKYISGSKIGFIVLAGTTGYADYLTVQW